MRSFRVSLARRDGYQRISKETYYVLLAKRIADLMVCYAFHVRVANWVIERDTYTRRLGGRHLQVIILGYVHVRDQGLAEKVELHLDFFQVTGSNNWTLPDSTSLYIGNNGDWRHLDVRLRDLPNFKG